MSTPDSQIVDFFGKRVRLVHRELDDVYIETLVLERGRTKSLILRRTGAGKWMANLELCGPGDVRIASLIGRGRTQKTALGALETEVVIAKEILGW